MLNLDEELDLKLFQAIENILYENKGKFLLADFHVSLKRLDNDRLGCLLVCVAKDFKDLDKTARLNLVLHEIGELVQKTYSFKLQCFTEEDWLNNKDKVINEFKDSDRDDPQVYTQAYTKLIENQRM